MTAILERDREARTETLFAAARRWSERLAIREKSNAAISTFGIGAGDTPKRQLEWSARQLLKTRNIVQLQERVIGTADFVNFAPSALASAAALPVARITTSPGAGLVPEGIATGFLLPGNLFITNWHVFPTRSYVQGSAANFNHAEDERGLHAGTYYEFDPSRFFISDAQLDFAIVAVKPKGTNNEAIETQGVVQLIEATGKVLTGHPLNIVQYPDGGPRRFAFRNNRLLDILPAGFLHYETDTRPGSSGSPVSSAEWELVGVHHSGVPRMKDGNLIKRDGTVWDPRHDDDAAIDWVANECTRVSAIVAKLRALSGTTVAEQAILAELLASTADPVVAPMVEAAGASSTVQPRGAERAIAASPVFNISGPVTINFFGSDPDHTPKIISPGAPASLSAVVPLTMLAGPSIQEKSLLFDADYEERTGYDAMFLGVEIPMPEVAATRQTEMYSRSDYQTYFDTFRNVPESAFAAGDASLPLELRYHHYSLAFNKHFRMCHWTASNCDYRDIERQDARPRGELGGENWRYDPRVPEELQLANSDVYGPAKRIDRGHIVRREDNAWGEPGVHTEYANSDTYHWTNCSPQHEAFNQENPNDNNPARTRIYDGLSQKGVWGQFETKLQKALTQGGGQATIFAGPVLAEFFPDADWGKGKIAVPKKFWKVFVVPESKAKPTTLLAYGYIFSQEPAVKKFGMTYEGIELPQFHRERATLSDISELAGVVFPNIVLGAEQAIE